MHFKQIPKMTDDELRRWQALQGPPIQMPDVAQELGPCIFYYGTRDGKGRGVFFIGGNDNVDKFFVKRIAFTLGGGKFVQGKPLVLSKCVYKNCVAFNHFFAGSWKDSKENDQRLGRALTVYLNNQRVFKACGHSVDGNVGSEGGCQKCKYAWEALNADRILLSRRRSDQCSDSRRKGDLPASDISIDEALDARSPVKPKKHRVDSQVTRAGATELQRVATADK